MIECLEKLFVKADEEKLECFAKLMTTVGDKLDGEKAVEDHDHMVQIWEDIYCMANRKNPASKKKSGEGPKAPSNRIKFLLQDLIDMRESGWKLSRRLEDEKAKTIHQIHQEVAEEAAVADRRGFVPKGKIGRSQSVGDNTALNNQKKGLPSSKADVDGFQQVARPTKKGSLRRVQSDVPSNPTSSLQRAMQQSQQPVSPSSASMKQANSSNTKQSPKSPSVVSFKSAEPEECKKRTVSILKEFFLNQDTADALLSIDELVGYKREGDSDNEAALKRAVAVVESGVLFVLERKESEAESFRAFVRECLGQEKLPVKCLAMGLSEPLDVLRDVEIDAPLSSKLLAQIIADWMTITTSEGSLSFDLFLKAPEYFRNHCRPAEFAKQVLACYRQETGLAITDEQVYVVAQLMSEEERSTNGDIRNWLKQP